MFDVFISYCHHDTAIVRKVTDDLGKTGLTVWQDTHAMLPGQRFRESINDALRNSRVVIIFISSRALNSRWVLDELDMAMLREKRERRTVVFPLLIGRVNTASDAFPEDLKGKHYIDLRFNFDKQYGQIRDHLIAAIRTSLSRGSNGKPLVRTILAYEFTGKNETLTKEVLTKDALTVIADTFTTNGLSIVDESFSGGPAEARAFRRDFVREWGNHTLRKIFLSVWESSGYSFSAGFTGEDFLHAMEKTTVLMHLFEIQRIIMDKLGSDIQVVTLEKDMAFYCEPTIKGKIKVISPDFPK